MVKRPQSAIGYYVNGILVRKPRKNENATMSEKEKHQKSNAINIQAYKYNLVKQKDMLRKMAHMAKISNEFKDLEEQIVSLKNASKIGWNWQVLTILNALLIQNSVLEEVASTGIHEMSSARTRYLAIKSLSQVFSKVVQVLFTADIEERTPLYYAAHTGHAKLVKISLALYTLSRIFMKRRLKLRNKNQRCTHKQWLRLYGFSSGDFGQDEFDLCILSALNLDTSKIFNSFSYSFQDLAKQVLSFNSECCGNPGGFL